MCAAASSILEALEQGMMCSLACAWVIAGMLVTPPAVPRRLQAAFSAPQVAPRDRARPAAPLGTASIAGRVVVMGTTTPMPIRRARITLHSAALAEAQTTDTDTDGRYRFDGLPAGAYRVSAEKPGFVALEYGSKRPFVRPSSIDLKDGQTMKADLALPRGAALDGRILDESGEPSENITVAAVRDAYTPSGRRPAVVTQATTDDLGRFRVHSLPPGDYYLRAVPGPRAVASPMASAGSRATGLALTYYPGTSVVNEARLVTVGIGQDLGGLDFTIARVPVARVTGQVLDSSGKPASTCGWRLVPLGGGPAGISGFALPSALFNFTYPAVPPGDYWLLATALPLPGAVPEFGATRISVAGQDITGVTVRTERGANLVGHVELDARGAPPPTARLEIVPNEVELEFPNPQGPGTSPARRTIAVAADGQFTIASLFGPKLLRVDGLPANWALKGVWLGDKDITDVVTDFRATEAPQALRVAITDRTASLTGTVANERGRAITDYRVIVFPEDAGHWGPWSRFIKSVTPDSLGRFVVDGLLPGQYLTCAVEYLEDDTWNDPTLLQRLRALAVPLTLAEGAKQTVTLTLKVVS
jgi:hypothetical protein